MKTVVIIWIFLFAIASCGPGNKKQNDSLENDSISVMDTKDENVETSIDAEKSGLLLGMKTEDGYKTYFVVFDEESITLRVEKDYIISPQAKGFHYLDAISAESSIQCEGIENAGGEVVSCSYSITELLESETDLQTFFTSEKTLQKKLNNDVRDLVNCDEETSNYERIVYVGTGVYIVNIGGASAECYGPGGGFDKDYVKSFSKNECSSYLKDHVDSEKLDEAYELLKKQPSYGDDISEVLIKDSLMFRLERDKGIVNLIVQNHVGRNLQDVTLMESTLGKAPKSMVVYNSFSMDYDDLKERFPEMTDAFLSPDNKILYIYIENDKQLLGLNAENYDELFVTKLDEKVVMVEWATANYVDKWIKAIE